MEYWVQGEEYVSFLVRSWWGAGHQADVEEEPEIGRRKEREAWVVQGYEALKEAAVWKKKFMESKTYVTAGVQCKSFIYVTTQS